MISSAVFAEENALRLPKTAGAAVSLTLPDGLAGDPSKLLQVFVGTAADCCDTKTPVAGRYVHEDNILSFVPAFGFSEGQSYVARVGRAQSEKLVPFRVASAFALVPAAVTEIYPSGEMLPENTLRFYIHFSTPMMPGVAFDYITLSDASGTADDAAFMRFKQELWNEDRTRLTVLLDPGRIKRNVATNLELGPALIEGHDYMLSVDAGWPSADGASVLPAFSKRFTVTAPLRELPDVEQWQVTAPCVGTNAPLHIDFDRPFDRHLLSQDIRVRTGGEQEITGAITLGKGELSWSLTPDAQWPNEQLHLDVSPTLEDVAANNFHDLLDHVANGATTMGGSVTLPIRLTDCSN